MAHPHTANEDPDQHGQILRTPHIDLFTDSKWKSASTGFPFRTPKLLYSVTISPPSEIHYDDVYQIQDLVERFFRDKEIKCIFVAEFTRTGRLHWHGIAELGGKVLRQIYIKDHLDTQLKELLEDFTYVDVSHTKSVSAWLTYITKEVHIWRSRQFEPIGNTTKSKFDNLHKYLQIPPYDNRHWHYGDMDHIAERYEKDADLEALIEDFKH